MTFKEKYKELLYELGYDDRDNLYSKNESFGRFIKEVDRDIMHEAQLYIEFVENCEDDEYIKLKCVRNINNT